VLLDIAMAGSGQWRCASGARRREGAGERQVAQRGVTQRRTAVEMAFNAIEPRQFGDGVLLHAGLLISRRLSQSGK
jgi:hypothetical protein